MNIGSINGQAGQYGQVNYAAAKSGIHGFTKALAQEERRPKGITVNAIAPGYIDTDMVAAVPADVLEKIKGAHPGRPARPGERDRARRAFPGRRRGGLRHRLDHVDQRRAAYVLRGGVDTLGKWQRRYLQARAVFFVLFGVLTMAEGMLELCWQLGRKIAIGVWHFTTFGDMFARSLPPLHNMPEWLQYTPLFPVQLLVGAMFARRGLMMLAELDHDGFARR